jgi:hypothetical protein
MLPEASPPRHYEAGPRLPDPAVAASAHVPGRGPLSQPATEAKGRIQVEVEIQARRHR